VRMNTSRYVSPIVANDASPGTRQGGAQPPHRIIPEHPPIKGNENRRSRLQKNLRIRPAYLHKLRILAERMEKSEREIVEIGLQKVYHEEMERRQKPVEMKRPQGVMAVTRWTDGDRIFFSVGGQVVRNWLRRCRHGEHLDAVQMSVGDIILGELLRRFEAAS